MKLNERSLAFYATCDAPVDNAGFLHKKGGRHAAYHRRWFVLRGNMLFYFEEPASREPVGVIILEGCTVELVDAAEEFAFAVRFAGARARTYVLAAESQAALERWVKALSRASFDYLRLVVRELGPSSSQCGLGAWVTGVPHQSGKIMHNLRRCGLGWATYSPHVQVHEMKNIKVRESLSLSISHGTTADRWGLGKWLSQGAAVAFVTTATAGHGAQSGGNRRRETAPREGHKCALTCRDVSIEPTGGRRGREIGQYRNVHPPANMSVFPLEVSGHMPRGDIYVVRGIF
uniref:Sesquipedalian n=1 Tax=Prolemur simus TaxID=1328070 RepID=A0A8C9B1H9_PROSS